ncbi:MAG: DUF423 domain-containing protein [Burkholderiaceae bacterium]
MSADRRFAVLGALFALTGVGAGAFGAHGLKARVVPELLAVFETGVRYQIYHALALLAVGLWLRNGPHRALNAAGWLFTIGTLVFSGSLYVLTLTGTRWLGAITPAGGAMLLIGWACLAWGIARGR